MMMKTREMTFVSLLVATLVAGGYVMYLLSRVVPVPGSKFLVMAPYLALMMFIAIKRLNSAWAMTLVSLVFGAVISVFALVMGLAIVAAGIASDLTRRLLPGGSRTPAMLCLHAALYPLWSFWLSLAISHYVTGSLLYGAIGPWPLLWGGVLVYALGLAGAGVGLKISLRLSRR